MGVQCNKVCLRETDTVPCRTREKTSGSEKYDFLASVKNYICLCLFGQSALWNEQFFFLSDEFLSTLDDNNLHCVVHFHCHTHRDVGKVKQNYNVQVVITDGVQFKLFLSWRVWSARLIRAINMVFVCVHRSRTKFNREKVCISCHNKTLMVFSQMLPKETF